MRKKLIILIMMLAPILAIPAATYASNSDDEDQPKIDARLDGYKDGNVALKDASGTGLTWVLLIVLGGLCIGVMFMNSKRSHLD